ncbi:GmrSD restriction endonuclease domain-containing protein [Alistipes sp.]|uniref:GmrSD restriction endonuclease domain-containing protein n=1 Tax=Alistipes sp. TaxID=1872444 RepID=UPI003AEFF99E
MSVKSHDTDLSELLAMVETGKAQLPEFQRSWVWDDTKICKLIESITSGFPMGAAMFLENGGNTKFKYRKFTGTAPDLAADPTYLVLDGQQRLTTLFQVFKCRNAVETRVETNREQTIKRYYYLDIRKALDPAADRLDAIVSLPDTRRVSTNIGREIVLDLQTREKEYEHLMFPLNITFSQADLSHWMLGLLNYYRDASTTYLELFTRFQVSVLNSITTYKIPVIYLTQDTPKEAVCQIFENVNTGGVSLTVFELVTATFAADDYDLRADWDSIRDDFAAHKKETLTELDGTHFITSMTLLVSYIRSRSGEAPVSCKKRDVLRLELSDYRQYRDSLVKGFKASADFLVHQGVYATRDLPYSSQLIPLAAVFAFDDLNGRKFHLSTARERLSRWYWCGVFGELYGGANETRFAQDIAGIFDWIDNDRQPDTVVRANFQATRLLTMQTRNSAAYKGLMALILQDSPLDFMSANKMDIASYIDENTDIHHIFPQAHCQLRGYPVRKWNSVINKTPIYASTNRSIGGRAPSEYIRTMEKKGLTPTTIDDAISSHHIDPRLLRADAFEPFFLDRALRLLDRIEKAMGKTVSGRESEDTVREFGTILAASRP